MTRLRGIVLATVFALGAVSSTTAASEEFNLADADMAERMTYNRAVDAAVWAMPLMNFKFYRDALAKAGVGPNAVGYNSKVQDWRF